MDYKRLEELEKEAKWGMFCFDYHDEGWVSVFFLDEACREIRRSWREIERLKNLGLADEVERLKKQRDDAVEANQSAAVCATHLDEFTCDGCLVCDLESLREQFELLLGEAKKGHKHADKQTLRVGRCGLCESIARAEEVLEGKL